MYAYQEYLKQEAPTVEQTENLLYDAKNLDMTDMTDLSAVALYEDMITVLENKAGTLYFEEAVLLYGNSNMEGALPLLEQAYYYTPDNAEVVYHLARTCHELGDLFRAKDFYEMILEKHQYSTRYQEAETYLGYVTEALKNVTPTPAVTE
jgi:tetratricopeptide (TPR) repeat protein